MKPPASQIGSPTGNPTARTARKATALSDATQTLSQTFPGVRTSHSGIDSGLHGFRGDDQPSAFFPDDVLEAVAQRIFSAIVPAAKHLAPADTEAVGVLLWIQLVTVLMQCCDSATCQPAAEGSTASCYT